MTQEGYLKRGSGFLTKSVHGGFDPEDEGYWPIVPSLVMSTNFEQEEPDWNREFVYSRIGNPTRRVLEKGIAEIENARYALCFSSGMGAVTTITCLLSAGDHIVAGDSIYGGTRKVLKNVFARMNIQTTFVDTCDPKNVENAITEKTKLVWVESPTNPLLTITDIAKVAEIVHKHKGAFLAVDNTFSTPYFQRPLDLGADISMESITKFINGHHDVTMGSIATNNKDLYDRLHDLQHALGAIPSPFDCYQANRGLKTLPMRMDRHMKSSIAIAKYLETKPQVEKVIHPGLPAHPQHELQKKQCFGVSGMLSFYIKGDFTETKLFLKSLKIIKYTGSLGGHGTTIIVPYYRSHVSLSKEEKVKLGITENLVRMSVGLEDVDDLIAELDHAFAQLPDSR